MYDFNNYYEKYHIYKLLFISSCKAQKTTTGKLNLLFNEMLVKMKI